MPAFHDRPRRAKASSSREDQTVGQLGKGALRMLGQPLNLLESELLFRDGCLPSSGLPSPPFILPPC